MKLRQLAHARAGDKGATADLTVVAYHAENFGFMSRHVTAERVGDHLGRLVDGEVVRYELPQLAALKFVFARPGGGVTRTVDLDPHGKALSSLLLELDLPDSDDAATAPPTSSRSPS